MVDIVQLPADPPPVIVGQGDPPAPAPEPVVALTPEPAPTPEPEDEFAKMFAQFSVEPTEPGDTPAPTPAPTTTAAPTPAPAEPAAPAPSPEPAPAAVLAPVQAQIDNGFERLAAALEARSQQPMPQPQQQVQQQPSLYNAEEIGALQGFYTEWPEVARAAELMNRAAVHQVTNHVFNEMARVLAPKLKMLDQLAESYQYDDLTKRIPDYATVTDKVAQWVNTQPAYLRAAYTGVMQAGTSEEVEDLVTRYKQATGNTDTGRIAPTVPANPPPASPPLSPAAIKAAARLAPVSGKRTGPTSGEPTTFDDGFAHFAKIVG
jgi:hypothetical protein